MSTITIPKRITSDEKFIKVPRQDYEEFLKWQKQTKFVKTYQPTRAELRELQQARKDFKDGKYKEWSELKYELENLPAVAESHGFTRG